MSHLTGDATAIQTPRALDSQLSNAIYIQCGLNCMNAPLVNRFLSLYVGYSKLGDLRFIQKYQRTLLLIYLQLLMKDRKFHFSLTDDTILFEDIYS